MVIVPTVAEGLKLIAAPPVVNEAEALVGEPVAPFALNVAVTLPGIQFAVRVTEAVGVYVPEITVDVSIQPLKT